MSGIANPRGPLPPVVYWRRRMAVLGIAALLVIGIGSMLNQFANGKDDSANQGKLASADPSESASTLSAPTPSAKPTKRRGGKPVPVELPSSTGPCDPSDVKVTPVMKKLVAGQPVEMVLQLSTGVAEACDWQLSPEEMSLKITSGEDQIWSTDDCPNAIVEEDLVLRRDFITRVRLTWNGKRSGEQCTRGTGWAYPGFYHLAVAALGGEPTDIQFELTEPKPEVITRTVTPEPVKPTQTSTKKPSKSASPTKPR